MEEVEGLRCGKVKEHALGQVLAKGVEGSWAEAEVESEEKARSGRWKRGRRFEGQQEGQQERTSSLVGNCEGDK